MISDEINPLQSSEDLYYLAYARYRSGKFEEALKTTERILAGDPRSSLGRALLREIRGTSSRIREGVVPTALQWDQELPVPLGWNAAPARLRISDGW